MSSQLMPLQMAAWEGGGQEQISSKIKSKVSSQHLYGSIDGTVTEDMCSIYPNIDKITQPERWVSFCWGLVS